MYGTDLSHSLAIKFIKAQNAAGDLQTWAIIDNFGDKQGRSAVSGTNEFSSEVICLRDLAETAAGDTNSNLDKLVDQLSTMMVKAKKLDEHQSNFYKMIDSLKAVDQTEKPRLALLIEKNTHKKMTSPNCVRKTHAALMTSHFVRWSDTLCENFTDNKDIVFDLSKLLNRLNKQNHQDKPLYKLAYQYSDTDAMYLLKSRIEGRKNKIETQVGSLISKFSSHDPSLDFWVEMENLSTADGFKPWLDMLRDELEQDQVVPSTEGIPKFTTSTIRRGLGPSATALCLQTRACRGHLGHVHNVGDMATSGSDNLFGVSAAERGFFGPGMGISELERLHRPELSESEPFRYSPRGTYV
ncbi:hypothetical protein DID80_06000 [Candidatus Marinamargulisbacteria bacterium SCGC AAA071-K20]|nr:hypothetical protein DID80_06000 [Candidatus Marinamargulisbacteria bacterium SCGC AAA071-K20]